MKLIFRLIALILFIVFFDFALKNTDEVVLHFFWGSQARSPMILLLLVFFVAGVALGVLAMMPLAARAERRLRLRPRPHRHVQRLRHRAQRGGTAGRRDAAGRPRAVPGGSVLGSQAGKNEGEWRREWDSNPRYGISVHTLSKRAP